MSKKPPPRAFVRPVFSLHALHNPVNGEQAVATSIQDKAPRSRNAVRSQVPTSLHRAMVAPVPHVIHFHEPEPLAQLAKQVQEPTTRQVAPARPLPLSHPAPGKNKIIPSRNGNAANNCTPMCQRIKNEVAQHSENSIFSLMNDRWGNKEAECCLQGRDAISVRWGGYLKSPENSVHT